jgi:TonB family protein
MKLSRFFCFTFIFWLAAFCAFAQDAGVALLERARSVLPATPMSSQGKLVIFAGKKIDGSYTEVQSDRDHWREDVSLPGYSEIRVAVAPKLLVNRTLDAEPLFFWAFFQAMHPETFLRTAPKDRVGPIKQRKLKGRIVECVQVTGGNRREVCIEAASADIASITTGPGLKIEYEYPAQNAVHFPSNVHIWAGGRDLLEAAMTAKLDTVAPDHNVPAPALEFGWCSNAVDATIIDKQAPHYPPEARGNRVQGSSSVYTVIEADGSLSGLKVVQSAGNALDEATLAAVRQWKYQPATCGGVPIRTQTVITVNYTLSN